MNVKTALLIIMASWKWPVVAALTCLALVLRLSESLTIDVRLWKYLVLEGRREEARRTRLLFILFVGSYHASFSVAGVSKWEAC